MDECTSSFLTPHTCCGDAADLRGESRGSRIGLLRLGHITYSVTEGRCLDLFEPPSSHLQNEEMLKMQERMERVTPCVLFRFILGT
jgi:hypothetical protein